MEKKLGEKKTRPDHLLLQLANRAFKSNIFLAQVSSERGLRAPALSLSDFHIPKVVHHFVNLELSNFIAQMCLHQCVAFSRGTSFQWTAFCSVQCVAAKAPAAPTTIKELLLLMFYCTCKWNALLFLSLILYCKIQFVCERREKKLFIKYFASVHLPVPLVMFSAFVCTRICAVYYLRATSLAAMWLKNISNVYNKFTETQTRVEKSAFFGFVIGSVCFF